MVCSVGIHSSWDLNVFSRQLHSWHPYGSSLGLRPEVSCRKERRDLWVPRAVQGVCLAERELLFEVLAGGQATRTPVTLQNGNGEMER